MTAGVARTRPVAPERPPQTHPPADRRALTEEETARADRLVPSYEDERDFMVIQRPDGQVIPPPPKKDPPLPPKDPPPAGDRAAAPPKAEPPSTNLRGPTPDEILADPLVRTVLDVFEGEVKRIHPRPRKADE